MLKIQYLKFSYTHSATKSTHTNIYIYIYICDEEEELVCLIEIVVAKMSDDERIDLSVELGILQNLLQAAVLHFWLKPFRPKPKVYAFMFRRTGKNDVSWSYEIYANQIIVGLYLKKNQTCVSQYKTISQNWIKEREMALMWTVQVWDGRWWIIITKKNKIPIYVIIRWLEQKIWTDCKDPNAQHLFPSAQVVEFALHRHWRMPYGPQPLLSALEVLLLYGFQ